MPMRSEQEVYAAAEAFAWYIAGGGLARRHPDDANAIIGGVAALEWVQGDDDPRNPIAGTLKDIAAMRADPRRK